MGLEILLLLEGNVSLKAAWSVRPAGVGGLATGSIPVPI
jgi:hypothetical protein